MIRNHKGKIFLFILIFLSLSYIFGLFSYLRYKYEIRFDKPTTFLYGVNFAIMLDESGYYENEYSLDDETSINVDIPNGNKEYFLYGRFVNSADPLVVILNDKVIYNGHPSSDSNDVFSRYYIKKHFVVELDGFMSQKQNKIIISTGNYTETYFINPN